MPAGVQLQFKNGVAKWNKHDIKRVELPIQFIADVDGKDNPFFHARSAKLLNDNHAFQENAKKRYPVYCNFIVFKEHMFVYIWDTREIVDYFNMTPWSKVQPITRRLRSKDTDEIIEQVIGHTRAWLKNLYTMLDWDDYHVLDSGLPLVSSNPEWQKIADTALTFNKTKSGLEQAPITETHKKLSRLAKHFMNHFENNTGIPAEALPKSIINELPDKSQKQVFRGGVRRMKIENVRSWTTDYETALVFALGDEDKIVSTTLDELKSRGYWVHMDVIFEFLLQSGFDHDQLVTSTGVKYYSENELLFYEHSEI